MAIATPPDATIRPRRVSQCLCLLALLAARAAAQVSEFEGRPIADIQFSPAQILDPTDLARVFPLKKGEPLRAETVARAIDGLFATGRFEDIVVEAEPSGGGVLLRFVTKNTWFVGGVTVSGKASAPPNRGQLESAAQFSLGAPFQEEDLTKAVEAMKRLLDSDGLYETEVKPSVERDPEAQQVFITFTIREGKRAKSEMPIVEGKSNLSESAILRITGWRLPVI